MNAASFPNYYYIRQGQAQKTAPVDRLVSMMNETAEGNSPLEAAKRALLDAKSKLDEQRNEQMEHALGGYRALRSRQTSYESELGVQRKQLENFQALSSRREALSEELSSAKAEYEACAAAGTALDMTQHSISLRVSALEHELARADHDVSALVEQANRYANAQRQYAAYLENTDQGGYAAFAYQGQAEYTGENFVSETSGMIERMEAGAKQWRERVFSYCQERGLTPYDFESYLQERHRLTDAYFAAQQRLSELLYAAGNTAVEKRTESTQGSAPPVKGDFDTVEISGRALNHIRRTQPQRKEGTNRAGMEGT